jgi:hypothetical protein
MALIRRRLPLRVLPAAFLPFLAAGVIALALALGVEADFSLQTGNLFLLLVVPESLLSFASWRPYVAGVGLVLFWAAACFGLKARDARRPGTRRGIVLYPFVVAFGAFLMAFGAAFVFDASVYGDKAPGGLFSFIYLDYAGLFDRPVVTFLGLLVLSTGAIAATWFGFEVIPARKARIISPGPSTGRILSRSPPAPRPVAPSPPARTAAAPTRP